MGSILFTPASLIDLLSKIDELSGYDVGVTETLDGKLQLIVGDSVYVIDDAEITNISVDESVEDAVEDANDEAYENLDESIDVGLESEVEPIESGVLKEIAKTLLVGGIVRLGSKLLKWGK